MLQGVLTYASQQMYNVDTGEELEPGAVHVFGRLEKSRSLR